MWRFLAGSGREGSGPWPVVGGGHANNLLPGVVTECSVPVLGEALKGMRKTRAEDGRIGNTEI